MRKTHHVVPSQTLAACEAFRDDWLRLESHERHALLHVALRPPLAAMLAALTPRKGVTASGSNRRGLYCHYD